MPSLMIHLTVAKKMIKELNLSKKNEELFLLGTIMPDAKMYKGSQDDIEYRKKIQNTKNINHFRSKIDRPLSYPDMNLFLKKYKEIVGKDITVFAYFIHLYTDYYYFRYILKGKINFLDEFMKKTNKKNTSKYILIKKNKEIISANLFFGKQNKLSLYKEYDRINPYIIEKYNIKIDKKLEKTLNKLDIKITEIKGANIKEEIDNLYEIINNKKKKETLEIFEIEDIYDFIENIPKSINRKYPDILKEIKLCYNNQRKEDNNAK